MMRCLVKFISAAILTTVLAAVVLAVTCYGPKEVTDRKKQEAEFKHFFGITPTVAVADIRFHEKDSFFGGYTCWMSFAYDRATYDAVIKAHDYKLSKASMIGWGRTDPPTWWPKAAPLQAMLYSRSQDDTPENEGFQFLEFMWHDLSSERVYFTKSYWD